MPKPTKIPTLKLHRASGRAYVYHRGRREYFGKHGLPTTTERYNRWVAKLLSEQQLSDALRQVDPLELTLVELAAAHFEWAKGYYRKNGKVTTHVAKIERHLRALLKCHRSVFAHDFGPNKLRSIQNRLVMEGYSRQGVNELVKGIRAVFKWGVSHELVKASIHQALCTVPPIQYGRSRAPEMAPIKPVDDITVDATLEALPEVVAAMVRLQRLTGMRPGEVCKLRPCDLDRTQQVWIYSPPDHKTAHLGRDRVIFIGPQAQQVLARYLLRDSEAYCFSPADSERKRRAIQHENRKTPLSCGTKPKGNPTGNAGDRYNTAAYRRAITRAVNKVNRQRKRTAEANGIPLEDAGLLEDWAPNQLRHAAGTAIRKRFGLEAAQVALGHSKADVTQVYAQRDTELAREVARKIG